MLVLLFDVCLFSRLDFCLLLCSIFSLYMPIYHIVGFKSLYERAGTRLPSESSLAAGASQLLNPVGQESRFPTPARRCQPQEVAVPQPPHHGCVFSSCKSFWLVLGPDLKLCPRESIVLHGRRAPSQQISSSCMLLGSPE